MVEPMAGKCNSPAAVVRPGPEADDGLAAREDRSIHQQAPVDIDDFTGDIASIVGGQEGDRLGNVDGLSRHFAQGDFIEELLDARHALEEIGLNDARSYAIDRNVVSGKGCGKGLRHADNGRLGRRVVGPDEQSPGLARLRGEVDDPSTPLSLHWASHGLAAEQNGLGVDGKDTIPLRLGELLEGNDIVGGGGIDQNVDRAEAPHELAVHFLPPVLVGNIQDIAAGTVVDLVDRVRRRRDLVGIDVDQGADGAAPRKFLNGGQADPLGSAGDDGNSVLEAADDCPS